jgi:hypothetical protein
MAASGALLAAGGAVVAVFAWSASGSGSGTVQDTTATPISVTATTGAADMYPGGPAGAVHFTLGNPNPYAVNLTSVSFTNPTVASAPNATSTQPCPASVVTLDPARPNSVNLTLAAQAANVAETVTGVLDLDPNAGDGCQGATFAVQLTLGGTEVAPGP